MTGPRKTTTVFNCFALFHAANLRPNTGMIQQCASTEFTEPAYRKFGRRRVACGRLSQRTRLSGASRTACRKNSTISADVIMALAADGQADLARNHLNLGSVAVTVYRWKFRRRNFINNLWCLRAEFQTDGIFALLKSESDSNAHYGVKLIRITNVSAF